MKTRQRIIAIARDKRHRILAIGTNKYAKSHPIQASFAKKAGLKEKVYLHAEIDSLIKARSIPHSVEIRRFGKDGRLLPSKPCKICTLALEEYGVKEIIFT